ncbi:MAG: hypothetical protein ACK5L3_05745 [Oscillospiraceae bacterium]
MVNLVSFLKGIAGLFLTLYALIGIVNGSCGRLHFVAVEKLGKPKPKMLHKACYWLTSNSLSFVIASAILFLIFPSLNTDYQALGTWLSSSTNLINLFTMIALLSLVSIAARVIVSIFTVLFSKVEIAIVSKAQALNSTNNKEETPDNSGKTIN